MPKMYEPSPGTPEQRRAIHDFIAGYKQAGTFLMTFRANGRPIMRPVAAFVEGWTVQTVTADSELKTLHLRRNPTVGYLWTALAGRPDVPWSPKNVWIYGTAELVEEEAQLDAFFARRQAATGELDVSKVAGYRPLLIRTRPEYLRAEGFVEWDGGKPNMTPVILHDFDDPSLAVSTPTANWAD